MIGVIRKRKGHTVYVLDGREVPKAEFERAMDPGPTLAEGISGKAEKKRRKRGYPIKSLAMAVHKDQIEEAAAHDRKLGVPTEYTKSGKPILRDAAHRKAFLRAHGLIDRNSFYGA